MLPLLQRWERTLTRDYTATKLLHVLNKSRFLPLNRWQHLIQEGKPERKKKLKNKKMQVVYMYTRKIVF